MARGGLDEALAARSLDAAARLRIAADAAAGLAYLHSPGGGLAPMLHRDVKSSNVLLDAGLRARVSDVGLARPQHGATMTAGVGTFGYVDPEYFATGERRRPPARSAADRAACQIWAASSRASGHALNQLFQAVLSCFGRGRRVVQRF